ncbi:MAG: NAD-dependent epimerase/dehydratase family protein [Flavobacteriales bacterium]|nr:NAD-dependent epimerase/dehydratase family protein [Flavobacteriales bacterium]
MGKILIIGSKGQIGTELTAELVKRKGADRVVAADLNPAGDSPCAFEVLDVMDFEATAHILKQHDVDEVYLLAALLSATAEKHPLKARQLNMESLLFMLEQAREGKIKKMYWPSSIAVFGPSTPRVNTPQFTVNDPNTVYGITKYSGELWCRYYFEKFGVDVRSLRYPGLISYTAPPGGGTTDYAVEIFHEALKNKRYTSFLKEDSALPMMYMPDAIRATLELMEAPAEQVKIRTSYNVGALSFTPREIAAAIKRHIPDFEIGYQPDFRQTIADSWPASIDDSEARKDWGWKPAYDLASMTEDMLKNLSEGK